MSLFNGKWTQSRSNKEEQEVNVTKAESQKYLGIIVGWNLELESI